MERPHEMQARSSAQGCNPILTLGGRISQGTALTVLAAAGVGSGLVLGWDSLVALGVSTFILSLLPCAAMCALGLCASRMGRKEAGASNATAAVPPQDAVPPATVTTANAVEKTKAPAPDAPAS
jgi:hypothetical protein